MKDQYNDDISFSIINASSISDDFNKDNCHNNYEIIFAPSARGTYRVEGREYKIYPGTVLLIKPLVYHYVELDQSSPFTLFSIRFSEDSLYQPVLEMLNKLCIGQVNGRYYLPKAVSGAVVSGFDRFEIADELLGKERIEFMRALLSQVIILLSAAEGENMSLCTGDLGSRVAAYLNDNIDRNIALDNLAKRFFVSKYHLCRAFKAYSGISVHSYINHKRIMYAKQLIESGESASAVAEKVGFGDYSAFYRAYVRIVGRSPTAE